MPLESRSRPLTFRFENLPELTRAQVVLWNWYTRVGPTGTEWMSWVSEIFGRLLEKPAGQQLQLVQTHLVDTHAGEKVLNFGSKQELSLGRNSENDVVLPASAIANKHARILLKDGRVYLEDFGTALGTYLWDRKIQAKQPQVLTNGDQFTVFPHRFRVLVERTWTPETDFVLSDCRVMPVNRTEFFQTSPATWRLFVLNAHPGGQQAVLELNPSFLAQLQQRILLPLGVEQGKTPAPSDDAMLGFIMLALLEHLNRGLQFPVQFSFVRGARKNLTDTSPGIALMFAVRIGGLTGQVRLFVPLDFLARSQPETPGELGLKFPAGLVWSLPMSAGFVDLTPDEIAQVGLGDILVAQHDPIALFPNDFSKGWRMVRDGSNSKRFTVDKYMERNISVEPSGETQAVSRPDIRSLPLRLQVILAEKEFSLGEVQSLGPGTIVELETGKSDPVRLMVNGKILGEGELVEVEGNLAVKVLRWRTT
jgi:flagellar motor switch/type III secretory pathway protein FliN